jgi:uncharacterized pyridoxamine 5'-phosphate oxidase family protein
LEHWDIVIQDLDEALVLTVQLPLAPRMRSTDALLVEEQILYLLSNRNVTPPNDAVELTQ